MTKEDDLLESIASRILKASKNHFLNAGQDDYLQQVEEDSYHTDHSRAVAKGYKVLP